MVWECFGKEDRRIMERKVMIKEVIDYGAQMSDPLNRFTFVYLLGKGGMQKIVELSGGITLKKEDPILNEIINRMDEKDKERDFALIFTGANCGLLIWEWEDKS